MKHTLGDERLIDSSFTTDIYFGVIRYHGACNGFASGMFSINMLVKIDNEPDYSRKPLHQ